MADPQGTVSWYDLRDAVSGGQAFGWGPTQNHGAFVGGLTYGGAAGLGFNGTTGYVSVPHHASLEAQPTNRWGVWLRFARGATGAVRALVSKGGNSFCVRINAAGSVEVLDGGVVTFTSAVLNTAVHTLLIGRDSTVLYAWLDGVYAGTASPASTTAASGLPLTIGAHTAVGGGVQDYFNGTMYAAAIVPMAVAATLYTIVLPKVAAARLIDVPAILTAWRDPADVSNVSGSVTVQFSSGRNPLTSASWDATNNVPGGTTSTPITLGGDGLATFPMPVAAAMNGKFIAPRIIGTSASGSVTWDNSLTAQWGLARLNPNVALGDNATGIGVGLSHVLPATHAAAALLRAATGPNAGDYAAGSAWTTNPAAVAGLPAAGAYLATQLQLVRRL